MQRLLKFLFKTMAACCLLLVIGTAVGMVFLYYFNQHLPDYEQLASYQPAITTRLYAKNGKLLAEYSKEKRIFIPIEAVPLKIKEAFLAAEDKNFFQHYGVDILGIIRAAFTNVVANRKRPMGASTITQQVAKNFLLSNELSYIRKIKEVILSLRLERVLSKHQILELYFNEIYFGMGAYGIAAAALEYFNKSLEELTIAETAFLAGLPKAPNKYHPERDYRSAITRRNWVISRMQQVGAITEEEAKSATEEPLTINKPNNNDIKADYFAEEVRRFLINKYGENILYKGGLCVKTTIDPQMQQYADQALVKGIVAVDQKQGWRGVIANIKMPQAGIAEMAELHNSLKTAGVPLQLAKYNNWQIAVVLKVEPKQAEILTEQGQRGVLPLAEAKWAGKISEKGRKGPPPKELTALLKPGDVIWVESIQPQVFTLHQWPKINGALVAIDPHTGKVLALSGGFCYAASEFNRATQSKRQTGSLFKSFVVLQALIDGFPPTTIVDGSFYEKDLGPQFGLWTPHNHDEKFTGPRTIRFALEHSSNILTIRVAELVGLEKIKSLVKTLGINDNMPLYWSAVLGSLESNPLIMAKAFGTFANGGKEVKPVFIERIQDRKGKTIYQSPSQFQLSSDFVPYVIDNREQLIDSASNYQLLSILDGGVKRGSARAAKILKCPVAAKTGTSNDFRDAWFALCTPNLVVLVYVGDDNFHSLGDRQFGGIVSGPIAVAFAEQALLHIPSGNFLRPEEISTAWVNYLNGTPTTEGQKEAIQEYFKPGQHPNIDLGKDAPMHTAPSDAENLY